MGFINMLKGFLKLPGSERREIIESYKREFERYDDDHLRQICRTAVSAELKKAASSILRERGQNSPDE